MFRNTLIATYNELDSLPKELHELTHCHVVVHNPFPYIRKSTHRKAVRSQLPYPTI